MLRTLLVFVVGVQVLLPVLLYLMRDRLVFLPSAKPGPEAGLAAARGPVNINLVHVVRPDGRRLAAYDARPPGKQGAVVLFFHGNAGNIAQRVWLLEEFVAGTGARTLMPDYSGYGGNEGSPSEEEVYVDGLAAYDHLVAGGVPADRIVLYGESLGGSVALHVATRRTVAGTVLQSTFASMSSMALRIYPWMPLVALLARGGFRNVDRVAEMESPVLLVHGTADRIVPIAEGRSVYDAARRVSITPPHAAKRFVAIEGAGHNNLFAFGGRDYLLELRQTFARWTKAPGTVRPITSWNQ